MIDLFRFKEIQVYLYISMNVNPESKRPDLESIINEVSASEDFQNLLKSVSKNIGDIVESSRNRNAPDEKPAVSPAISSATPPTTPSIIPQTKAENIKDDLEIRTVPLDPSASVDDDEDNLQDTILTLLSDGEGNTLGDIASSIDHHLGKISSSLETLVQHHTKKTSPPSVELPKIPTLEVD